MARLVWAPAALADVARLHDFLASKSPDAARRAAQAIRQGAQALAVHPEIGRPLEEMPPAFREWLVPFGDSAYVMLYRVEGNLVVVLAVRHGREAGY